jgi:Big-like domain-containing protein
VRRASLLWLALAAVALSGVVTESGADFTRSSASPGNAFVAAADFNTVAVSITDPGTPLRGTVALQATASSERGIDRVRFQSSPAGAGTWTDACEDASAPYSCNWDTAGVADGSRDVRAVAVDQAGYQRTSLIGARLVDNTLPAVALNDPGFLQGTETLTATGSDAGSGLASLAISYRPAGGSWTQLCTGATSPRSCGLNTTVLADGSYELRARSTDAAGNQNDATLTRTVDNTAPTVSVVAPSGPLRGTVTHSMNAADGTGTGVTGVTLEFRPSGGAWSTVCTDNAAPYECAGMNTTTVPDGLYEARATATDGAGLSTTSAIVTNIRVDNTAPSLATLTNPATTLTGNVALSGTAADAGSGVAAWVAQYSIAGANSWTDGCSDTVTPFTTCTWATAALMDGRYDLRAQVRDVAGNVANSTVRTNKILDNDVTPTGTDIQVANVGATVGRAEQNDTITLTYSEPISPTTVNASFTGASMAIRVSLTNNVGGDRMDFTTTTGTRLNLVNSATGLNLGGTNYVTGTVTYNANMVQTANTIVITLGTVFSGGANLATQATNTTMSWTPSGTATDWSNHAVGTAAVPETGTADREF